MPRFAEDLLLDLRSGISASSAHGTTWQWQGWIPGLPRARQEPFSLSYCSDPDWFLLISVLKPTNR